MKPHKIILTCFALLVLGVCSLVINTSANAAICHNGGRADYRGLIKYTKAAKRAKSHVECDTILIDQDSASDTFPVNDIETSDGRQECQ